MSSTALYRHFDAAGRLLYVGISLNSIQRTAQHRHGAHWFRDIARIDIEWLPERRAALTAEAQAIATEAPLWNLARPAYSAPAKPARAARCFAVLHQRTQRRNGWFPDRIEAEHMLGWMRAVFPRDQFSLITPAPGVSNFIHERLELKSMESHLWAATTPDYRAGHAFDEATGRA